MHGVSSAKYHKSGISAEEALIMVKKYKVLMLTLLGYMVDAQKVMPGIHDGDGLSRDKLKVQALGLDYRTA